LVVKRETEGIGNLSHRETRKKIAGIVAAVVLESCQDGGK